MRFYEEPRRLKFRGKRGAELYSRDVRLSIDSFLFFGKTLTPF